MFKNSYRNFSPKRYSWGFLRKQNPVFPASIIIFLEMFSFLIAYQLVRLLALSVMPIWFPEQVFWRMRGYIKKKILKDTFCPRHRYLCILHGRSGSGDPMGFLPPLSWWGQGKGPAVLISRVAFSLSSSLPLPLPCSICSSFSFFLSFFWLIPNSLFRCQDLGRVISWGPTELVAVVLLAFWHLRK